MFRKFGCEGVKEARLLAQAVGDNGAHVPICETNLRRWANLFVGIETTCELVDEGFGGRIGEEMRNRNIGRLRADKYHLHRSP